MTNLVLRLIKHLSGSSSKIVWIHKLVEEILCLYIYNFKYLIIKLNDFSGAHIVC